ncbi:MAG: hypothetical protein FWH32_04860, partial [Clostridiales bacterium]|nr:hypothetical protein [Clostridiales bacterium]
MNNYNGSKTRRALLALALVFVLVLGVMPGAATSVPSGAMADAFAPLAVTEGEDESSVIARSDEIATKQSSNEGEETPGEGDDEHGLPRGPEGESSADESSPLAMTEDDVNSDEDPDTGLSAMTDDEDETTDEAAPPLQAMSDGVVQVNIGTWQALGQFADDYNAGEFDEDIDPVDPSKGLKPVHAQLTADITFPDRNASQPGYDPAIVGFIWTPIGTHDKPFTGIFDGNGHIIQGLNHGAWNTGPSPSPPVTGLFGYVEGNYDKDNEVYTAGIIRNVRMSVFTSTSSTNTHTGGGIAAQITEGEIVNSAMARPYYENGDAGGVYYETTINPGDSGGRAGGIVGKAVNSKISGCYFWGQVSPSMRHVGGIVGEAVSSDPDIPMIVEDCYFDGVISASPNSTGYVGGIAGLLDASSGSEDSGIFRSYSTSAARFRGGSNEFGHNSISHSNSPSSDTGGIVGRVDGGQVKNNVTMFRIIRTTHSAGLADKAGRIAGAVTGGGEVSNNYAWDDMLIATETVDNPDPARDGISTTSGDMRGSSFWSGVFAGAGGVWSFQNNRSPVLSNMPAGAYQPGELPKYLVSGNMDFDPDTITEYEINNEVDLVEFAAMVNSGTRGAQQFGAGPDRTFTGITVKLTKDLDLSDYPDWIPIGIYDSNENRFGGVFDGGGHVIRGLSTGVARRDAGGDLLPGHQPDQSRTLFGLFGMMISRSIDGTWYRATVKDLIIEDAQICVPESRRSRPDDRTTDSYSAHVSAGTLAARTDNGPIVQNCAVVSTQDGGGNRVWAEGYADAIGGLVGWWDGGINSRTIPDEELKFKNNLYMGEVDGGANAEFAGGLAGIGYVTMMFRSAAMPGPDGGGVSGLVAGGLIGFLSEYAGNLTDCYSTMPVNGGDVAGGLAGGFAPATRQDPDTLIRNCYSTEAVTGVGRGGGILGGVMNDPYRSGPNGAANGRRKIGGTVALGSAVSGAEATGRIGSADNLLYTDYRIQPDGGQYQYIYNYANGHMRVNGTAPTSGLDRSNFQGASIYRESVASAAWWSHAERGYSSERWILADGKMPVLTGMPQYKGDDLQSDVIPSHIRGENEPEPTVTITIDTQPERNTTVVEDNISGSLTVAASVDPSGTPLTYQWYSNTTDSNVGGTAASSVSANPDFAIPTGLTAGTYYYFCEVRALGATPVRSDVAEVTVEGPPPFVSAMVEDDVLTITFGAALSEASVPDVAAFSVDGITSDDDVVVLNVNVTDSKVTLELSEAAGDTDFRVTVSYDADKATSGAGTGLLMSADSVYAVRSFENKPVTNLGAMEMPYSFDFTAGAERLVIEKSLRYAVMSNDLVASLAPKSFTNVTMAANAAARRVNINTQLNRASADTLYVYIGEDVAGVNFPTSTGSV